MEIWLVILSILFILLSVIICFFAERIENKLDALEQYNYIIARKVDDNTRLQVMTLARLGKELKEKENEQKKKRKETKKK